MDFSILMIFLVMREQTKNMIIDWLINQFCSDYKIRNIAPKISLGLKTEDILRKMEDNILWWIKHESRLETLPHQMPHFISAPTVDFLSCNSNCAWSNNWRLKKNSPPSMGRACQLEDCLSSSLQKFFHSHLFVSK